jgi:L-threonylcarbamoyladenylate synthase
METQILPADDPGSMNHAVDVLNHSGLVAFPTDTVYGIGAAIFDQESVRRLYVVKGRNTTKAIAVLLSDPDELEQLTPTLGTSGSRLAQAFWPGPLTLVVPKRPNLPEMLSPLETIGVRIPDHPVALALLRLTGPLAVTSANLSGAANTLTAQEVYDQLNGRIHLILDGGKTKGHLPSTVVDSSGPEPVILRPGPITLDQLQAALA